MCLEFLYLFNRKGEEKGKHDPEAKEDQSGSSSADKKRVGGRMMLRPLKDHFSKRFHSNPLRNGSVSGPITASLQQDRLVTSSTQTSSDEEPPPPGGVRVSVRLLAGALNPGYIVSSL